MPLAFPDGSRLELSYARELRLDRLGLVPYSSAVLKGTSGRDFLVAHDDVDAVLTRLNDGTPPELVERHETIDGESVGFWDLQRSPDYLGFQFGRWAVLVWDRGGGARMTARQRAAWAQHLRGTETPDGFLRLSSSSPRLRLARAGDHAGPALELGAIDNRHVRLALASCDVRATLEARRVAGRPVSWRRGSRYAMWCLSDAVSIQVRGAPPFIRAAIRTVQVRRGS